ncbi:MAG TPA: hypothetical protein PL131_11040 [Methylotenera sp.]|nr:hypothetical protein [Methylotenera sp.]HPH06401.1 hypothetical protein [Methylotenera sp.]HPN01823.1 hypothetical protein [Methylotenera sp.]
MKKQLFKLIIACSLAIPLLALSETNSISLGDLFKKVTQSPVAQPAEDAKLGENGFKSPDEVKRFLQGLGWFKGEVIDVIDSPAFEGFYTLIAKGSDDVWWPNGMHFSKTDNFVIGSDSNFKNAHQKILYEVANQKLIPSTQSYETFVKTRMLPKINHGLFIKITYNSIEPKAYVISAADCPFCRKLEKNLYKAKVSHYVLPDYSMTNTDTQLGRARDIQIVCGGEKPWIDKMVNNIPFKNLEACTEKYDYYLAKDEIHHVLRTAKLMRGFPTTILFTESESAAFSGYCDAIPKLINKTNLGQTANLNDCK